MLDEIIAPRSAKEVMYSEKNINLLNIRPDTLTLSDDGIGQHEAYYVWQSIHCSIFLSRSDRPSSILLCQVLQMLGELYEHGKKRTVAYLRGH